ncbi:hypothetical protein [Saccharothrix sp. HUAS TT1]|uniref:hypothetical protein n=1 Tax=Saccharothrix sp. HUAS TT1 TaxID=3231910 RepID=UPI00345B833F
MAPAASLTAADRAGGRTARSVTVRVASPTEVARTTSPVDPGPLSARVPRAADRVGSPMARQSRRSTALSSPVAWLMARRWTALVNRAGWLMARRFPRSTAPVNRVGWPMVRQRLRWTVRVNRVGWPMVRRRFLWTVRLDGWPMVRRSTSPANRAASRTVRPTAAAPVPSATRPAAGSPTTAKSRPTRRTPSSPTA